jgi:hypothetical protein
MSFPLPLAGEGQGEGKLVLSRRMGYIVPFAPESTIENRETAMAKGQMRGNKEKKKPKQDKNKDKGGAAPSPFAGMHSQAKPGTWGKKN